MRPLLFPLALIFLFFLPFDLFAEAPFVVTESAVPIEKDFYRAEARVQFSQSSTDRTFLSGALRYGLIHNLEVMAMIPYLFADNDNAADNLLGDLVLSGKVRFLRGREASPLSVGGEMRVKIPFGSENILAETTGKPDVGFFALASKAIPPYEAHLNVGYTFIGNPANQSRSDQMHYALGVSRSEFRPNVSIMGELFGSNNTSGISNDHWVAAVGGSYQMAEDMVLDGAFGMGLSSNAPDYLLNARVGYSF